MYYIRNVDFSELVDASKNKNGGQYWFENT